MLLMLLLFPFIIISSFEFDKEFKFIVLGLDIGNILGSLLI